MKSQWVSVDERYPAITKENPYPTCIVWKCWAHEHTNGGYEFAELRLLGGDANRPYWCSTKKSDNLHHLENSSWKVTHWLEWTEGGNSHGMLPACPCPFVDKR